MTLKNHSKVLHTIKIKEHDIHALKIKYEGNKQKILRLCKKKKKRKKR